MEKIMDADAKKILKDAVKGMNPQDAQAAALWFLLIIMVFTIVWYIVASWVTLLAVNALFGPVVAVEFPQMLAVAWFLYLIRNFNFAVKAKE
jgi:hypothetical protein